MTQFFDLTAITGHVSVRSCAFGEPVKMRVGLGLILILLTGVLFRIATAFYPSTFGDVWHFFQNNQFITALVVAYVGYAIELLRRADDAARQLETLRLYIYFSVQDRLNKELRLRKNLWMMLFKDKNVTAFVRQHVNGIVEKQAPDDSKEVAKLVAEAAPKIEEYLETFRSTWDGGLAGDEFALSLADLSAIERKLVFSYINKYKDYADRSNVVLMKSRNLMNADLEPDTAYRLLSNFFDLRQTSAELSVDGIEIIGALAKREQKLRNLRPVELRGDDQKGDVEEDIQDKFDELRFSPKFKERWEPFIRFSS